MSGCTLTHIDNSLPSLGSLSANNEGYWFVRESEQQWQRCPAEDVFKHDSDDLVYGDTPDEAAEAAQKKMPKLPPGFCRSYSFAAAWRPNSNERYNRIAFHPPVLESIESLEQLLQLAKEHKHKCLVLSRELANWLHKQAGDSTDSRAQFEAIYGIEISHNEVRYRPNIGQVKKNAVKREVFNSRRKKLLQTLRYSLVRALPVMAIEMSQRESFAAKLTDLHYLIPLYNAIHGKLAHRRLESFCDFIGAWPEFADGKYGQRPECGDLTGVCAWLDSEHAACRRTKKTKAVDTSARQPASAINPWYLAIDTSLSDFENAKLMGITVRKRGSSIQARQLADFVAAIDKTENQSAYKWDKNYLNLLVGLFSPFFQVLEISGVTAAVSGDCSGAELYQQTAAPEETQGRHPLTTRLLAFVADWRKHDRQVWPPYSRIDTRMERVFYAQVDAYFDRAGFSRSTADETNGPAAAGADSK